MDLFWQILMDSMDTRCRKLLSEMVRKITHSLLRSKRAAVLSPDICSSQLPIKNMSKHNMIADTYFDTLCRCINSLWLKMKQVSSVMYQQLLSQTGDGNSAWNHRLLLCNLDNLHHIHWRSQTHHSVPLSSQTLRGWSRLGIVPVAPLASDSAHQYWGSFLGCAANTLIITLNHSAVMGYQSCQLWCNEMEDRKRLHHGYGHIGRNCATHNHILSPNREHLLAFFNVQSLHFSLCTDYTNEM